MPSEKKNSNPKPLLFKINKKEITFLVGLMVAIAACKPQNAPAAVKPPETSMPPIVETSVIDNISADSTEIPQQTPTEILLPVGSDPTETITVPSTKLTAESLKNSVQGLISIEELESLVGVNFDISELQNLYPDTNLTAFGATNGAKGEKLRYTVLIMDSKTGRLVIPNQINGKTTDYPSYFAYSDVETLVPVTENIEYGLVETAGLESLQVSWNGEYPSVVQNLFEKNDEVLFAESLDGSKWEQNGNYFDQKYESYAASHQMSFKIVNGELYAVREKFYENEPEEYAYTLKLNEGSGKFDEAVVPDNICLVNGTECGIETIYTIAADREMQKAQLKIIRQRIMDDPNNPMMQYVRSQTDTLGRLRGPDGIYFPMSYYISDYIHSIFTIGDATPGLLRVEGMSFPDHLVLVMPAVITDYNGNPNIQILFPFSDEAAFMEAGLEYFRSINREVEMTNYYTYAKESIQNIGGKDNIEMVEMYMMIFSGSTRDLSKSAEHAALIEQLDQAYPEWRKAFEYYFGSLNVQRDKDPEKDEMTRTLFEDCPLIPAWPDFTINPNQ